MMRAHDGRPGAPAGPGVETPAGTAARARPHWPALTLEHVWLAAVLAFAFVIGTLLRAEQTDYWWTVKLGELLGTTGSLPAADPLAFTSTRQPYIEQQWLAQAILAATHRLGGLEAALLLRAGLLVLSTWLLFHVCRRVGAAPAAGATACGLALLSVVGGAGIRPQLFAIPLFVLFLAGTTIWAGRRWALGALPLGMVVWANLHGSFPLGVALVGVALVGRAVAVVQEAGWPRTLGTRLVADGPLRRLTLVLVLCTLAPLANPYGLGIVPWLVDYLTFNTGGTGLATLSIEWLPTSLATAHGVVFFLSVFLLVAVLLRAGPPAPAECLRLAAFAVLALQAVRSTLWWALVMAPVLAWGLTRLRPEGRPNPPARRRLQYSAPPPSGKGEVEAARRSAGVPALNAVLIGGFAVVAALSVPWLRPLGGLYPPERWPVQDPGLPVAAADFASRLESTRLYNTMDWGGYLAWRLAPRQRIFVDGRFQLYPPELYQDYFAIARAEPGWDERLVQYGVDGLLVSRTAQRELLRALGGDARWRPVYCDDLAAVYVPRDREAGGTVACGPAQEAVAPRAGRR
jgi:hypothetical protein